MYPDTTDDKGSTRAMVTIPTALLRQVDHLAKADYMSRSDLIRRALTEYLRKPQNLEILASVITGKDVSLQRFLDEYNKEHPENQ